MYVIVLVVVGQRCGDRVQTINYNSQDVDFALSISDQKGRQVWYGILEFNVPLDTV